MRNAALERYCAELLIHRAVSENLRAAFGHEIGSLLYIWLSMRFNLPEQKLELLR